MRECIMALSMFILFVLSIKYFLFLKAKRNNPETRVYCELMRKSGFSELEIKEHMESKGLKYEKPNKITA